MTSEPATFLWAEIEGFRGFRDSQRIELDASIVILAGPNGTGKTSFFDALQWLLLGSLERLEPWRPRRNTEHIANVFRVDDPAIVRVGARLGGRVVELRRQGRHDSGFLEWSDADGVLRGEEAERRLSETLSPRAGDQLGLRRLLMTSALLQQDVVREVLEDKPAERYQHLAALLGLDELGEFEVAARRRADRLAASGKAARDELAGIEDQDRRARERIDALRTQQASAPDTTRVRTELGERLKSHTAIVRLVDELPTAATDALLLQTSVRDLGDELTQVSRDAEALRVRAQAVTPAEADALAVARRAADEAAKAAEEAKSALARADANFTDATARSEALALLATSALPLLGDRCPVCQQKIVKEEVERHLGELIERGGVDLPRLQAEREAAHTAANEVESRAQQALLAVNGLIERESQSKRLAADREGLMETVRSISERARQVGVELVIGDRVQQLDPEAIASTIDALRAVWAVSGDLAGLLRNLPTGDQIATAEAEVRRLETQLAAAREKTAAASAREEEARTLQRAATRAATAVTEDRFRLLAPLVGDIFSRLDPHPVFKTLDFALGVYRERGVASPVVRDDQQGVEADPLVVFSSSQANVAALSYFLALGWAAGADAMPFVLLDDPLQSLDDVNALGFADLCRHIRQQRQLIVSTHDPRLAALLERKLAPRTDGEDTRVVEFKAWTRRGPELEQRIVEPQLAEGSERTLVASEAA